MCPAAHKWREAHCHCGLTSPTAPRYTYTHTPDVPTHAVVLGCRSRNKCDAAAEYITTSMENADVPVGRRGTLIIEHGLDLNDRSSMVALVERLEQREGLKLTAVLNNAGFGHPGPDNTGPTALGYEPHFGPMHLGHFYLTEKLLASRYACVVSGVWCHRMAPIGGAMWCIVVYCGAEHD